MTPAGASTSLTSRINGITTQRTHMEDTRLPPKCVMFGELVGGAGCVGGQEKELMGCFLDDLRAFGINTDQWTTCSPGRGRMAQDGGTRGGTFHGEERDR